MSSYKSNKRWRKNHNETWQAGKQRYYKQFEAGTHNSHQRYTNREDNMIINKKYPDRVIAKKTGRSVKAIQIRRSRLREEGGKKSMTIQCKAKTDYVKEEQCSRRAKVTINGVGFCIPHAAKICLQQAIKNGIVEAIDPEDWFYKKIIDKTVKIVAHGERKNHEK